MVQTITFRPTKRVWNYLKRLDNKSKEINDIIEQSIGMPLPSMPMEFPSEFPPKSIYGKGVTDIVEEHNAKAKIMKKKLERESDEKIFGNNQMQSKLPDDVWKSEDKVESSMQKVLSEITQKVANSDDFYDDEKPAAPVKDKKYYKDLETYKEIKKKHGCVDKYGERLDTSDALKYAGLEDFTPLD